MLSLNSPHHYPSATLRDRSWGFLERGKSAAVRCKRDIGRASRSAVEKRNPSADFKNLAVGLNHLLGGLWG